MAEQSQGRLDKNEGSYYTPAPIVEHILDIAGYKADAPALLSAYVIDPAAGDGAILLGTVARYIQAARTQNLSNEDIKNGLIEHVFAYEIDETELSKCKHNICELCQTFGIEIIPSELIHFLCGDAFDLFKQHANTFDYVVGNPPYVRIHNLEKKPESRYINGMCDLFYPFFDIGQTLLKENTGILSYIAPSSWFTSVSGKNMREDLHKRGVISGICDFGHYQVFAPYATAYTAIVRIGTTKSDKIDIYDVDTNTGNITNKRSVDAKTCWVEGAFLPGCPEWFSNLSHTRKHDISVKNGYATNLDKVFISKTSRFEGASLERDVIKASKCERQHMIYPYDKNGNLIPFSKIKTDSKEIAKLLEDNKDALLARTQIKADAWWAFGRSQGIADTFTNKIAIQSLVKPGEKVRCMQAPAGTGVYGGVYVLGAGIEDIEEAVNSEEFFEYAKTLRKYKSGGYYALGGKDIERFLNWYHDGWEMTQLILSDSDFEEELAEMEAILSGELSVPGYHSIEELHAALLDGDDEDDDLD